MASISKFRLGDLATFFHDLENWPYDSPQILQANPIR